MSKNVLLRLPQSLHESAKQQAKKEGVSLNTFLISIVSAAVAVKEKTDG